MTALPNWGQLSKAVDDATTIDEAITAAIDAHDTDSSSHLGAGASLAAHKAFEVIDHPAGSVVGDKFERAMVVQSSYTEDLSSLLYGHGTNGWGVYNLWTQASTNDMSILLGGGGGFDQLNWANAFYIRHVLQVMETSNVLAYWGAGCDAEGDGYSGAGFKFEDGTLYAYMAEDPGSGAVFTTSEIAGIDVTAVHTYEVINDPDAGSLTFFIDGVQVAQFTSGLPTASDPGNFMIELKTKENVTKRIYAYSYYFTANY